MDLNSNTQATNGNTASSTEFRNKMKRWKPTETQLAVLCEEFKVSPYISVAKKDFLAQKLGVQKAQVSKWFQHKRENLAKLGRFECKKQHERRTPEELALLEELFLKTPYPSNNAIDDLHQNLTSLSTAQIKLWFKHKRNALAKKGKLKLKRAKKCVRPPSETELVAVRAALAVVSTLDQNAVEKLAQHLNISSKILGSWLADENNPLHNPLYETFKTSPHLQQRPRMIQQQQQQQQIQQKISGKAIFRGDENDESQLDMDSDLSSFHSDNPEDDEEEDPKPTSLIPLSSPQFHDPVGQSLDLHVSSPLLDDTKPVVGTEQLALRGENTPNLKDQMSQKMHIPSSRPIQDKNDLILTPLLRTQNYPPHMENSLITPQSLRFSNHNASPNLIMTPHVAGAFPYYKHMSPGIMAAQNFRPQPHVQHQGQPRMPLNQQQQLKHKQLQRQYTQQQLQAVQIQMHMQNLLQQHLRAGAESYQQYVRDPHSTDRIDLNDQGNFQDPRNSSNVPAGYNQEAWLGWNNY